MGLRREVFGRPLEGCLIRDLLSRQNAELRYVRRDDLCEWEELLHEYLDGIIGEQLCPARRDHDGIHHHVFCPVSLQLFCDDVNECGRSDHADLDGIRADVFKDSIELCRQEFRRHFLHHADALRVLGRQRSDSTHPIDAIGKHRLEICLDPCAAARITARDCQYLFHMDSSCMSRKISTLPSYNVGRSL